MAEPDVSSQQYHILAAIDTPVLTLDTELHIQFVNPSFTSLFGISTEDRDTPLDQHTSKLPVREALVLAQQAVGNNKAANVRFQDKLGRSRSMLFRPVVAKEQSISGIAISCPLEPEFPSASTEQLSQLFNAIDDGFCLGEMLINEQQEPYDFRYLEANQLFGQYTGLKTRVGQSALELNPSLAPRWINFYGKVALGRQPAQTNLESTEHNRRYSVRAFPVGPPESRQFGVHVEDVSHRKLAEEARKEEEDHFRNLADTAPVRLWVSDPQGNCTFLSQAWYDYTGLTPKDSGTVWQEAVHPDDLVDVQEICQEARQNLEAFRLELRLLHQGGNYRWNQVAGQPRTKDDHFQGYVGSVVDIHHRKGASEALVDSESKAQSRLNELEAIYASAPIGLCVLDTDLRFVRINERLAELNGLPADEHIGKTIREVIPEVADTVEPILREVITTGKSIRNMELTGETAAHPGVNRTWLESWFPIYDDHDNITGINVVTEDVTDQKRAEELLRKSKEEAVQAVRVKENFLSTMSHEIRTPLNAIIGLSNLLLARKKLPEQLSNLQTLHFSSQNLLNLVDDILDYSKLDAGKVEVETIEYDLGNLLENIVHAQRLAAEERGNTLVLHLDEEVPLRLIGDNYKLAQILNNLLSNAIKFTEHGIISLTVGLEAKMDDTADICFSVQDSGIGISSQDIELIFERFTQADSSTARRYGGTGLGLSIVKSLLSLMDSDIQVRSEVNEGSTFFFTLRQSINCKVAFATDQRSASSKQYDRSLGSKLKILLSEDAAINRMMLQQYLYEWLLVKADEATNGREAVEQATKNNYDLILMDIRMPEIDGNEAARRIRASSAYNARVPILALTADTHVADNPDGKQFLFDAWVTKPFNAEKLRETILALVAKPTSDRVAAIPAEPPAASPAFEPDFSEAESRFKQPPEVKKFYELALKTLQTYCQEYLAGLEHQDLRLLSESLHKHKLLLDLLGLTAFQRKLRSIKERLPAHFTEAELAVTRREVSKEFEVIITTIQSRLTEIS